MRANSFRTPGLRARFVAAHALVRTALSSYAPVAPEAWRIAPGPQGRPCLLDSPIDLHFSLSHSEGHAAVAVAMGRSIGIDLEEIDATVDVLGIAGRFFTRTEQSMLRGCSGMERPERFTTLWTIKEAVLKARGADLASGLTTVEVQLGTSGEVLRLSAPDQPWSVTAWSPVDGLRAALAVQAGTMPPLRFFAATPLGPVREAPELGPA
jgi:4'-phosphopantetheinyl transferase